MPPYYLVCFLFVDLLGYKNLGQFEKASWSVPIGYNGTAYLLEHRKFGMGLFATDKESQEIVKKISKAVKVAQPYFEWVANQAAKLANLNVINHSLRLHERYLFLTNEYKKRFKKQNHERMKEYILSILAIHGALKGPIIGSKKKPNG